MQGLCCAILLLWCNNSWVLSSFSLRLFPQKSYTMVSGTVRLFHVLQASKRSRGCKSHHLRTKVVLGLLRWQPLSWAGNQTLGRCLVDLRTGCLFGRVWRKWRDVFGIQMCLAGLDRHLVKKLCGTGLYPAAFSCPKSSSSARNTSGWSWLVAPGEVGDSPDGRCLAWTAVGWQLIWAVKWPCWKLMAGESVETTYHPCPHHCHIQRHEYDLVGEQHAQAARRNYCVQL